MPYKNILDAKAQHAKYFQANKTRLTRNMRAYGKTFFGKLVRTYLSMKQRTLGQDKKHPFYQGKSLCSRECFYKWAKKDEDYKRIFTRWRVAGYPLALSPSIDRINKSKGYDVGNMQFLTHSANSQKH